MVAVIGSGMSIRRTFLYNENKVKAGAAECIMAANYPLDLEQTNPAQRLNMLLRTASLNPDVKRHSIHISLNFAPGEQLADSTLKDIAMEYMEQIGFGGQPFLTYRHDDVAHPHIHIVTTKIRPDGSRINTQNIGKDRSEPARRAIEKKYGLVEADKQKAQPLTLQPVSAARVAYGEQPTRKAINNVLQAVLSAYKFASLPELNAVLGQYNIMADRGSEQSRIYRHKGLIYHVLDPAGKPVGVPVKASDFYNNPGLRFLEKQYLKNDVARQPHKTRVKNAIDLILLRYPTLDLNEFTQRLKAEGIQAVIRQNAEGFVYGLTYVDFRTKCVFNGSAIGKGYSAKGILDKLFGISGNVLDTGQKNMMGPILADNFVSRQPVEQADNSTGKETDKGMLHELMGSEFAPQNVPFDWKRRKKKRKKK